MRKGMVAFLVVLGLVATALAQDTQRPGDRGRRGRGRDRGQSMSRMVDRLSRTLNLDEEQLAKVREITAAHEQDQQDAAAQWQEVRQAMEAGDEEKANELRAKLMEQRGAAMEALFDEIQPVLHEDQLAAFQQMRERLSQRRGPGGPGDMFRIMRELPDVVNMTDEQRQEYQVLLRERRAGMRERMMERRQEQTGEGPAGGPPGEMPDPAALLNGFFDDVAEILNEDQVKLLIDYRAKVEAERAAASSRRGDDVRTLLTAAKAIRDLSGEQKDAVRDIEREATQSSRELRRDREGQALLAAQVKENILKLLNEPQAEEFQKNLDRLQSRSRQAERGNRRRPADQEEDAGADRPERP